MKCSKCAAEMQPGATTCPVCGAEVSAAGGMKMSVVVAVAVAVIAGALSFLFLVR